eukprot:6013789-Lingulodinium_polyedra.AAC.1
MGGQRSVRGARRLLKCAMECLTERPSTRRQPRGSCKQPLLSLSQQVPKLTRISHFPSRCSAPREK